ncbi:MBL fold metallo-hydrolase [Isoptericola sp. NPDC056134]|uniref:MBL fold metallo-hydrolase n=1 Tax=Isoptericola sp. NPDC056134 TaxID=3345723 RepID=UPI0035EF45DE
MTHVTVVRADNPGPMTLDGTRSYVLRAPGSSSCVVVDPGPDDERHLATLAEAGPVDLVLVTHRHADHTAGSARLRALTGAPVRAADPGHCHGGEPLRGGETIDEAGLRVDVLATPGHTADSVSFVVAAPGPSGTSEPVVLTGDTVLGQGTTVIAEPDGSLRDYLASLDALERVGDGRVGLPGHGPGIEDLGDAVRVYRRHRLERLDQVRSALATLGPTADADAVVAHVYAEVDPSVRRAARQSVVAQLAYLQDDPA